MRLGHIFLTLSPLNPFPVFDLFTHFFGGYSEGETPVPIPNTEVKLLSADGTALETGWESRSPPGFISNPSSHEGFFIWDYRLRNSLVSSCLNRNFAI